MDQSIKVYLPNGISDLSVLAKWRDSLCYLVMEKPTHGMLNTLSTNSDSLIYTPHVGYIGQDFFSYKLQLGSLSTATVNVSLTIVDPKNPDAIELGLKKDVSVIQDESKNANDFQDVRVNSEEILESSTKTSDPKSLPIKSNTFKSNIKKSNFSKNANSSGPGPKKIENMRIEDLFTIQGTNKMKDRFNSNLGMNMSQQRGFGNPYGYGLPKKHSKQNNQAQRSGSPAAPPGRYNIV
jgi:hypothetical protein